MWLPLPRFFANSSQTNRLIDTELKKRDSSPYIRSGLLSVGHRCADGGCSRPVSSVCRCLLSSRADLWRSPVQVGGTSHSWRDCAPPDNLTWCSALLSIAATSHYPARRRPPPPPTVHRPTPVTTARRPSPPPAAHHHRTGASSPLRHHQIWCVDDWLGVAAPSDPPPGHVGQLSKVAELHGCSSGSGAPPQPW